MRNFKTIDAMSYDECMNILEDENISEDLKNEILERLSELEQQKRQREKEIFDKCKTIQDYQVFIKNYLNSPLVSNAKSAIDDITFEKLRHSKSGCKKYLKQYPKGLHISEAEAKIQKMNRNRIIAISVFVAIIIVLLVGYKPAPSFRLSQSKLSFEMSGGTQYIRFCTDAMSGEYEYEAFDDWIEVSVENNNSMTISVSKNTEEARRGKVRLVTHSTFYGQHIFSPSYTDVIVSQESGYASYITTSQEDVSFSETSGTTKIDVSSDGYWSVSETYDYDWCHVTQYDNYVTVRVDYNDEEDRTASFTIKSGSVSKIVRVKQCAKPATYLRLDDYDFIAAVKGNDEGKFNSVYYYTDGKMVKAYTDGSDWLSVSVNKSYKRIEIKVEPNKGRKRYAYVMVEVNSCQQRIKVTQKAKTLNLSLSRSSYVFDTKSDYKYFDILCDGDEQLEAYTYSDSWITCYITSSKKLKVSVSKNDGTRRDGTVYVKSGDKETSITIKQDGWQSCNCYNGYVQGVTRYTPYGYPIYGWVRCNNCGGSGKIKYKWSR